MASASDGWLQYWAAWGEWRPVWQVRRPGGSVPAISASPSPTPSATPTSSAIPQSDQHDYARLRAAGTFLTGPISGRVKDRDINLAGDANRSAHRARSPFKAKAGSRRRHHKEMASAPGSYSALRGGISHAHEEGSSNLCSYGRRIGPQRSDRRCHRQHKPCAYTCNSGCRYDIIRSEPGQLSYPRRGISRRLREPAADRTERR
jgi:hypothetical protein